ncbi:NEDD1-like [Homarus americanus]|uniref:NEDD1-like n=1 Tax=Homarus americanus TaxID=6706 RepID=A0A8J5MVV4_HOMAM|nr:NEDD1-like [Homarus americanus]
MGSTLLATAGSSIKLWDLQDYSLQQEIPSENGRIQGLTWNQDGQCLASLGKTGDKISLTAVNAKSAANIGAVNGIKTPSCVKFASRSPHYLGIGNRNGAVTIWNVKSQMQKKVFSVTDGTIARISFSHNDSHITAATEKGSIYLLSVVNNSIAGPFKIFDDEVVTDLTYSSVKKPLLGCCSDRGSIALFDSHVNKIVHSFPTAHSSPVSAILFSPVNELLMVSAGYDKQFASGGQQVALGTMTGQVFIHDLRMLHPPVAEIPAYNTAVTNVLLQPPSRSRSENSAGSHMKNVKQSLEVSLGVTQPSKSCSGTSDERPPSLKPLNYTPPTENSHLLDVFSPIRSTDPTAEVNMEEILKNPPKFNVYGCSSTESLGIHDVFSPIRSTDGKRSFSPLTHKLPTHNIDIDDLLSPYTDGAPSLLNQKSNIPQIKKISEETGSCIAQNKENMEPTGALGESDDVEMEEGIPDYKQIPVVKSKKDEAPSPLHEVTDSEVNAASYASQTPCKKLGKAAHKTSVMSKPETNNFDDFKMSESSVNNLKTDNELTNKCMASPDKIPTSFPGVSGTLTSDLSTSRTTPLTVTSSKVSYTRTSPPKKRQLLRSVQASDLVPEGVGEVKSTDESCHSLPAANLSDRVKPCDNGVPQLQVELIRSCMAEVMEEFQDDVNRRLMHLQYVMTKKFLEQQEMMERLHRQYSLNEDLLVENERLRQENSRLKAKY